MATGDSVKGKVAGVLKRLEATAREVKFRTMTVVGGDPVLGIGGTVTFVDTRVEPQPAVDLVKTEEIATSGGLYVMGDYHIIFAGSVLETTLKTSTILYGAETLKIIRYEPNVLQKVVVAWDVIARAVSI
jgi:hypothetical protein